MTFTTGTKLGPYEITGSLGAGGMGEVYRARDAKLKRDVAIKVLPAAFSRDSERLARFQREAEVLASLNHPHIAAIYDLADVGESRVLIMELVEGQSLAERISLGPIPLAESLSIARAIAEALEAAHEKGVIHRDLKPGNIQVTHDGMVKVLDFGIAKVRDAEGNPASLGTVATMVTRSVPGIIIGTPAYMPPEQAKGRDADRTTDIWAFGCLLYEMLTGSPAFKGETVGEVLAEVFKSDPDWSRLPHDTPESIRRLLRRCLQKERRLRLHDIADARIEIEEAQKGETPLPSSAAGSSRRGERVMWAMLLAAVALFAVLAVVSSRQRTAVPEMRVDVATPPTADPAAMSLSADGQKIVFSAISDGRSQLWLRSFDADSARILAGTDGGLSPFWSPDGQSVGFFADGKLKRIDLDNGAVRILATVPNLRGGAWNADGTILVGTTLGPILRIPASGGAAIPQTHLAPQQIAHRSPQFMPDGRHFLFRATGAGAGLYIGQIDGPETRLLNDAEIAIFLPSGFLLFIRQEMLFVQAFDSGTLSLTGEPFLVAERVLGTALSASQSGTIAYRTGSAGSRQLNWFDRTGKELGRVAASDSGTVNDIALSPDGRRLAFRQTLNGRVEIWLVELALGTSTRLTFGDGRKFAPVWSPDGSRVAFQSNPKAVYDLYLKSASGAGTEELILSTPQSKTPMDWSPDGRFLLYRTGDSSASYDLWAVPVDGDRKPFPVVQSSAQERDAQFSPDGKWIAYQSDESGSFEIYLQPFVIPGDQQGQGGKWQVSHGGGAQARWRPDGKELFYIAPDENLVAVPVRLDSLRHSAELGAAMPLFRTRVGGAVQDIVSQQYAVASDGQRFLMNTLGDEAISPITVVLNWRRK